MNNTNSIVVCKDDYNTVEDFENAVKKVVMVLLDNSYIMTVKYDGNDRGMGIVVINFEYADQEYGADYPYWLSPEEIDSVITDEERKEMAKEETEDYPLPMIY